MYEAISSNKRKSAFLIAAFAIVLFGVISAFNYLFEWGWIGVVFAVFLTLATSGMAYWKSDSVALAMSRAKPADPDQFRQLHNLVEGMAIASGMPKPRVYVVEDPAPNAFATGRNPDHAAIAVTTGLLQLMNRQELEGVIAHELSHIKNYDILVSTLTVTMVGIIVILADFGARSFLWGGGRRRGGGNSANNPIGLVLIIVALVLLVLSPLFAKLMQAAVSRRRESFADAQAIALTRYPPGLISALEKLRDNPTVLQTSSRATAHLWLEDPLSQTKEEGAMSSFNRFFHTHPPIQERIDALRNI